MSIGTDQKKRAPPREGSIDDLCINTIRTLIAMDAVQQANSGHPGTPMALAPLVYTHLAELSAVQSGGSDLAQSRSLRVVQWPRIDAALCDTSSQRRESGECQIRASGRARGLARRHQAFRQLGSKCPGHPEYHLTSGVETTTGPLGQGCGTSVGMALAGRWLAQHFNRPDFAMFDYDVYVICGDGDMMEGVSSEAASFAGHQMLGNLCWFYDSNRVTIEGHTDLAFSDDVAARFLAYGWNVQRVGDVNDLERLAQAIEIFRRTNDAPTLIIVESHIGYGAPHKHDTSAAHGEPLGEEEIRLAKRSYGWPEDAKFLVPDGVREHFRDGVGQRGGSLQKAWLSQFESYRRKYPDLANEIERMQTRELPADWDAGLPVFPTDAKGLASARLIRQGAQRHCLALPLANRRLCRPRSVYQDAAHIRGRRRSGS